MAIITFGAGTHTGNVRSHNEDSFFASKDLGLWLVADGMGGHAGGEIASSLAKDTIVTSVSRGEDIEDAIQQAHLAILQSIDGGNGKMGMGTTAIAMRLDGDDFKLAWVGDSRAYRWNGVLSQISKDQSLVQVMVDMGTITREEARFHPRKNIITQYVGQPDHSRLQVDSLRSTLDGDQKIILCSDGLSDEVGDDEIADVLSQGLGDQAIAERLIELALLNGGRDNITVIVVSRQ